MGQRIHRFPFFNREADEQGFQTCVAVATLDGVTKSFKVTDPWPFKQNTGVRSHGGSRWDFLSGAGAGVTSEPGIPFHR